MPDTEVTACNCKLYTGQACNLCCVQISWAVPDGQTLSHDMLTLTA